MTLLANSRHYFDVRANIIPTSLAPFVDNPEQCRVPCFKADVVRAVQSRMPDDGRLDEAETLFAALADRTRLKILLALRVGEELCVCDVSHVVGLSISTASHHLRRLRDLRILKCRNDGKMSYYSVRDALAANMVFEVLRHLGHEA